MLRRLFILFTALILCSLIIAPAGHAQAYTIQASTSNYEPDNRYLEANLITNGSSQTRSIVPAADIDWIKFKLSGNAAVTLTTSGPFPSDTRIRLYKSNGTNPPSLMEVHDDIGDGNYYSFIDRVCGIDPLPAGTYLVRVEEYLHDAQIQSYNLSYYSSPCPAELTNVFVGGQWEAGILVPLHGGARRSFAGVNNGPVRTANTGGSSLIAAERVIYKVNNVPTSFSEMMALPDSQLDTTYWLPWYNNKDLSTQLRFANVSDSEATVSIQIGGQEMPGSPFTLDSGASSRKSFTGIDRGPVRIESDVPIVAAERVVYNVNGKGTSFTEMMALPNSQLDTTYWLPWYNNKDLDTQLRFANVSGTDANVHVYIGGVEMPGSPFPLAPGASTRKSFIGIDKGPVKIESDVPIVAAERVVYNVNGKGTSFSEMMALPNSLLDTTYWLPWYNNVELDTQLRIANTTGATATVHVYIGGVEMTGSPFDLEPNASIRKSFPGIDKGPVRIVSNEDIVAAERVVYKVNGVGASFTEMMALPNSLLDTTYWLPWYNNVELDTQLRFGLP